MEETAQKVANVLTVKIMPHRHKLEKIWLMLLLKRLCMDLEEEEEEEEFADFVFAAAFDETDVNTELLDE